MASARSCFENRPEGISDLLSPTRGYTQSSKNSMIEAQTGYAYDCFENRSEGTSEPLSPTRGYREI